MNIAIASGKGGTGKTTVAVNLALALAEEQKVQLLDCDVEEPNAALFLDLELEKLRDVTLNNPVFDEEKCTNCGKCGKFCAYHAIAVLPEKVLFFPGLCHDCGGCALVCPEDAISWAERPNGTLQGASKDGLHFVQGELQPGEAMATPVIRALKREIWEEGVSILDSPPGNACPVIEVVRDADYSVLVTEPTPFGLSDLRLTVALLREMSRPFGVIINRDGEGDNGVEEFCKEEGIPVLMKIPEDRRIAQAYSKGLSLIQEFPEYRERFLELFRKLEKLVKETKVEVNV